MMYQDAIAMVYDELDTATRRFGPFRSSHEGYAILKEEVDELWDSIKANDIKHSRFEAAQVAAMAIRYLMDIEEGMK
jgi:hypothetical protein